MKIVGYLKKKKTKGFFNNLFKKTNLRYFECSFREEYLGYKKSEKEEIFLNIFDFQDITDVYDILKEGDLKSSDWKHGFKLQIQDSTYTLFAKEEEEKNNWLKAFKKILKINRTRPKPEHDLGNESNQLKEENAKKKKNEKENAKNVDDKLNPTVNEKINYKKPKISLNFSTHKANDKKLATKGNLKKFIINLEENPNSIKEENPSEAILKSADNNNNTNPTTEIKDTSTKNKEVMSLNLSLIKEDSNNDINFSVENEEIYNNEKFRKNEATKIYKKSISNPDDLNCFYMRVNTKGSRINKKAELKEKKNEPDPEQYTELINLDNFLVDQEEKIPKKVFDKNREEISQASTNIPEQQDQESSKKIKCDVKKILIDSIKIFTEGNSFVAKKSLKDLINNQPYSYGATTQGNIFDALGATNSAIQVKNIKNPAGNQKEIMTSNMQSDKEIYGNVDESVIKYFENYSKAPQFESTDEVTISSSRNSGKIQIHSDSKQNSLKNVQEERMMQAVINQNDSDINFLKIFEEEKKKRTANILNNGINFDNENKFVMNKMKKRSEITKVADEMRSNPLYSKVEKKSEKIIVKNSENSPEHISIDFKVKQANDVEVSNEFMDDWN